MRNWFGIAGLLVLAYWGLMSLPGEDAFWYADVALGEGEDESKIGPLSLIYEVASGDPTARIFTRVIFLWFGFAIFCHLLRLILQSGLRTGWGSERADKNIRSVSDALTNIIAITPGGLTIVGVLGTFTGIFIGLYYFNVEKPIEDLPNLLQGLKIAFVTSIIGMASGLGFRFLNPILLAFGSESSLATPEDIQGTLTEIRDNISEGQKELGEKFENFAKNIAQTNSDALIAALREVIQDFNTKINEQFGENFKKLNEAVHKMVEWQDKYREHVETLQAKLDAAIESLASTEKAVANISEQAAAIAESMQPVPPVLEEIQNQTATLSSLLESMAGLQEKASEAFPMIEENLRQLTDDLKANVDEVTRQSAEAVAGARKAQEGFSAEIEKTLEGISQQAEKQFAAHGDMVKATVEQVRETIDSQMKAIDSTMQEHVKHAIEGLGERLTALANKFVKDYEAFMQIIQEFMKPHKGTSEDK